MPLRPSDVGTIGCEGYSPSLAPRLLVEGSDGHQEFTDELSLFCGKAAATEPLLQPHRRYKYLSTVYSALFKPAHRNSNYPTVTFQLKRARQCCRYLIGQPCNLKSRTVGEAPEINRLANKLFISECVSRVETNRETYRHY